MAPAPDLIRRDFTAARPDERWVADITEFATFEGKLHLAAIVHQTGTAARPLPPILALLSTLMARCKGLS